MKHFRRRRILKSAGLVFCSLTAVFTAVGDECAGWPSVPRVRFCKDGVVRNDNRYIAVGLPGDP